jgi:S-formylglutathione hydrolase FrmB
MRRRSLLVVACAAIAAVLGGAGSAEAATLTTVDTPSANVDPGIVRFNGPEHRLRANVMLPDGYDGKRRYPVLFLLHGAGDTYRSWADPERGDILQTARGLQAIVVMPEAATGFYANWWNGGRRGSPGWERFYLDELVPLVERSFRVMPGRRWHAIAGLSMGGLGATFLASQLPGYFGSAATSSGFVEHQRAESEAGLSTVAGVSYGDIFGPRDAFYATGHNPTRLTDNLRSTRLFVAVGSGVAEPGVKSSPSAIVAGGLVEAELRQQADEFVGAARASDDDVTYSPENGVHDWPYWRRHLREAIAWDLFGPVAQAPTSWTYRTVAQRGDAWGLSYSFAAPPEELVTLSRRGRRLRGSGSGTVTISNGPRCSITTGLPFESPVPPRICGRLRVSVAPRRLRIGHTTRVRVRVVQQLGSRRLAVKGAAIRLGRERAHTNGRGRAVVRYRPRGRAGVRRLRVSARSLGLVKERLRVSGPRR